ncbi:MAG: sucrase ferredoxin [Marmoricola sp.]
MAEDAIGSAQAGRAWVCLEQPGAWGPKAFTSSHLDPVIGKAFEEAASSAGVRPQLIRAPGRHPEAGSGPRQVLVASTDPTSPWLLGGQVEDPRRILDLDFEAIARGEQPRWPELEPLLQPVLLVCTNGRRDVCCATLGRPVADAAAAAHPGRVWEANHLSGHRFAATTALLPSGHVHGRVLDGALVLEAADRGELLAAGWRGRSTWPAEAQVAEATVRERERIWDLDGLQVNAEGPHWSVSIGRRSWVVEVSTHTDGMAPPSCGKEPEPVRRFTSAVQ